MTSSTALRLVRNDGTDEDLGREDCYHCGAVPLLVHDEDNDERCTTCHKSHRVCSHCGDLGGEVCIVCDTDWCVDCWHLPGHMTSRAHVRERSTFNMELAVAVRLWIAKPSSLEDAELERCLADCVVPEACVAAGRRLRDELGLTAADLSAWIDTMKDNPCR